MDTFNSFLLFAPVLLFSMVAHEYAHGWVAYRNGDPTAYQLGRLTWNPARHIDPFMTVLLPLFLFMAHSPVIIGGAKPVPVNPRNYRHYKRADIMVSLAGVTTNVILAFISAALIPAVFGLAAIIPSARDALSLLQRMLVYGIQFNVLLAAFNLIPIPPLDGSHVFKYALPPALALSYARISRFGILILYGLLFFAGPVVMLWFRPAFALADGLLSSVQRFILPASARLIAGGA